MSGGGAGSVSWGPTILPTPCREHLATDVSKHGTPGLSSPLLPPGPRRGCSGVSRWKMLSPGALQEPPPPLALPCQGERAKQTPLGLQLGTGSGRYKLLCLSFQPLKQ